MSYLRSQVKVTVHGQHRVAVVLQGQREEAVAVVLEELLKQKLGRSRKECMLAVRGTDVLGRYNGHRAVRYLPERIGDIRALVTPGETSSEL